MKNQLPDLFVEDHLGEVCRCAKYIYKNLHDQVKYTYLCVDGKFSVKEIKEKLEVLENEKSSWKR